MGTTLTGTQINNTYDGLIKVTDNGPIGATAKTLTDGLGNDSCVALGTLGTTFTGTADFTGATVTGITDTNTTYDLASAQSGSNVNVNLTGSDATTDTVTLAAGTNITLTDNGSCQITIDAAGGGGAAGLVAGTGTDSMKNADSLVTTAATASNVCTIALGNAAEAAGTCSIAIGNDARAGGPSGSDGFGGIAIGNAAKACCADSIAIGRSSGNVTSGVTYRGIHIGCGARAGANLSESIAIGTRACYENGCSIAIGNRACARGREEVMIGCGAIGQNASNKGGVQVGANTIAGHGGVALGRNACASNIHAIAIGGQCNVFSTGSGTIASGSSAIAIGNQAQATGNQTVVLGRLVVSSRAQTVVGRQFEACTAGQGIIVTSPDGLTTLGIGIDNTGAIVTYTP